ncbi:MAG: hypothetical protein LBS44_03975 [Deltaproteobacteria bacterium]|jgi:hypothetical protein|nr:hypothetical protein [Deltaproteobacteria bacterium]
MTDIKIKSKSAFAALKDETIPLPGRLEYQTKEFNPQGTWIVGGNRIPKQKQ